ncbi:unnamed protein product [Adineta steineri]|uniref:Uncharacterized protein n=1 Tax=Adineta steineri TaxID=433720 RepID=A0A813PGQ1_9BILA|nr:unnamed protein product [Adineta steineri]CAF3529919.1 unnamed protein product [Adineta steineri]CAF3692109.1 unnamed protein product [Adineta steineri]
MINVTTNATLIDKISSYDTQGAIIFIIGVIAWYSIGFGLVLIDTIGFRSNRIKKQKYTNVYRAVNDLHEQKIRNDILIELTDKNKRKKLWDIYYGNEKTSLLTIEKDKVIVNSIIKQLDELNEQRRLLQNTLYGITLDQSDDDGGDETENNHSIQ